MAEGTPAQGSDCNEALRELYEYLDGELTSERRTLIHRHLDRCPPCNGLGDFEIELRQVIAMRCQETVPDHLKDRVAHAIEALGDDPASA